MTQMARSTDKLGVFVSYSRNDIVFADQLYAALSGTGFNATLDRHGIFGAEQWQPRLLELIRTADAIVFVISPSSAKSEICAWEVEQAAVLGKRIVPIVMQPLGDERPPKQLSDLNYIYFCQDGKAAPDGGF